MNVRFKLIILVVSLALLAFIPFYQVVNHRFVNFDDYEYVVENPYVNNGLSIRGIEWAFTAVHSCNWHPLTWISHMMDCEIYGLDPSGHHMSNLILHTLNTMLLFLVLMFITGSIWKSAVVAALFAIHPLHVESVAWISERKDVLSALFWILTMGAYAFYSMRPNIKRYSIVLLFFILGLMSKPMIVTLPFVLLLLDYWPLLRVQTRDIQGDMDMERERANPFQKRPVSILIAEKIPLFLLSLGSSVITVFAQSNWGVVKTFELFPLRLRLLNALLSYLNYLKKMVWPVGLGALYPYPDSFRILEVLAVLLLILSLFILALRHRKRHPYFLVGLFWYTGTLVPVIGLVQVGLQSMADRYTYIPMIGIFIVIVWGFPALLMRFKYRFEAYIVLVTLILFILVALTFRQVRYWKDSITLMRHTLNVTKANYLAYNGLGVALVSEGNIQEGLNNLYKAIEIKPDYAIANQNIGISLARLGRLDEAIFHYKTALNRDPCSIIAHNSLGIALFNKGDVKGSTVHFREAIRLDPYNAKAYNNLGIALMRTGDINEAIMNYKKAIEIYPDYAVAHYNLGVALEKRDDFNGAKRHYNEAIRIDAGYIRAHYNLGMLMLRHGDFDGGMDQFSSILMMEPGFVDARFALGYTHLLRLDFVSALKEIISLKMPMPDKVAHLIVLLGLFAV